MDKANYIVRRLEKQIVAGLSRSPVVAIVGPRQCGKSTLAQRILAARPDALYIDLERPSHAVRLSLDAEQYLSEHRNKLICIDEIQRRPELFPLLRSLCDEWGGNGHFLILGSASRDMLRQSSETLAGRIEYRQLTPFLKCELPDVRWIDYMCRGGFPRSCLAASDEDAQIWRDSFITTFLERDLAFWREFVPETMRRLWRMLAHENGQTANFSRIASSLCVSDATVRRYIDLLKETFMVEIVPPFEINLKKRLVKSPKVYISDTGILCSLLGITSFDAMFSNAAYGSCWEQMVLREIRGLYPDADITFFRTAAGAEIDFVVTKGGKKVAIECKASSSPSLGKGNYNALEDISPDATFVIAPVDSQFPIGKGITVAPLDYLPKIF